MDKLSIRSFFPMCGKLDFVFNIHWIPYGHAVRKSSLHFLLKCIPYLPHLTKFWHGLKYLYHKGKLKKLKNVFLEP